MISKGSGSMINAHWTHLPSSQVGPFHESGHWQVATPFSLLVQVPRLQGLFLSQPPRWSVLLGKSQCLSKWGIKNMFIIPPIKNGRKCTQSQTGCPILHLASLKTLHGYVYIFNITQMPNGRSGCNHKCSIDTFTFITSRPIPWSWALAGGHSILFVSASSTFTRVLLLTFAWVRCDNWHKHAQAKNHGCLL